MSMPDLSGLFFNLIFTRGRVLFRNFVGCDGEAGDNPARCRHCERGVILHKATVCQRNEKEVGRGGKTRSLSFLLS